LISANYENLLTDFGNYDILSSPRIHSHSTVYGNGEPWELDERMIPFERRQRIVSLLREQPGVKVTELARQLGVSEGTIRNDLNTLEDKGELTRVRGGAIIPQDRPIISPAFAARLRVNAKSKQCIARNAAAMVESGDSILLDASTTVFAMVPYLANCRNLTVVTNCIEAGVALARNASHAVILVGGTIRSHGASVVGPLGERILDDLHVKFAFVSCSGFSPEAGLTEVDIQEVQLKKRMIRSAERVIALIDSTKFGKVDLTSFASLEQVSHIFTDGGLDPHFMAQLRQSRVSLTVCNDVTAWSSAPTREAASRMPVGEPALLAIHSQQASVGGEDPSTDSPVSKENPNLRA
jgi:DeoR/GlpR family transcriptional regulator of sugar metabolism